MARYCKKCGRKLDAAGRCTKCGWSEQAVPVRTVAEVPAQKKKGGLGKLLVFLSVVFLIVCALQYFDVVNLQFFGEVLDSAGLKSRGNTGSTGSAEQVLFNRPAAEDYLAEIGTVTDKKAASGSALLTEAEAVQAFAARGFANLEITASYDANGNYSTAYAVSASGTKKHPSYEAVFRAENGKFFVITLVGGQFFVNTISFMEENRWDKPHILSETGDYLAYGGKTNTFYTLSPNSDKMVIRKVERIDKAALSGLSAKEVAAQ